MCGAPSRFRTTETVRLLNECADEEFTVLETLFVYSTRAEEAPQL